MTAILPHHNKTAASVIQLQLHHINKKNYHFRRMHNDGETINLPVLYVTRQEYCQTQDQDQDNRLQDQDQD